MVRIRHSTKTARLAAASLLALTALTGCAGSGPFKSSAAQPTAQSERGVAGAEAAVRAQPRDAAARVALGHAYLETGRFASAAASFGDAMTLGEDGGRVALSLALAKIGAGRPDEAVIVLDDNRDAIPASDLGLAFALAGESGRGVAILSDALRAGDTSVKTRQNMAYAFALDGRWREARLMAAQDLSPEQVDGRISDWAMLANPGDVQKRVAALLGVAVRSDPGLPQELALTAMPAAAPLMAQAPAMAPAAALPAAADRELPAIAEADLPPVYRPAPAPAAAPAPAMAKPAIAAASPVTPKPAASAPAASAARTNGFAAAFAGPAAVAAPATPRAVPQPAAARPAAARPAPAKAAAPVRAAAAPAPRPAANGGTHQVQLGSFASEEGARRAWTVFTARNPELRSYRMAITPVSVNGRSFWRVSAAGFDAGSATRLCSGLRNRGGTCLSYAGTGAPATATGASAPAAKARRR
jgi:Flp pilus assembly protein TadD